MNELARWWKKRLARRRLIAEALVAAALREQPDLSGWPLMQQTGLTGRQVYAALERMQSDGRVTSRWDEGAPEGRSRRFYRFTGVRA